MFYHRPLFQEWRKIFIGRFIFAILKFFKVSIPTLNDLWTWTVIWKEFSFKLKMANGHFSRKKNLGFNNPLEIPLSSSTGGDKDLIMLVCCTSLLLFIKHNLYQVFLFFQSEKKFQLSVFMSLTCKDGLWYLLSIFRKFLQQLG